MCFSENFLPIEKGLKRKKKERKKRDFTFLVSFTLTDINVWAYMHFGLERDTEERFYKVSSAFSED